MKLIPKQQNAWGKLVAKQDNTKVVPILIDKSIMPFKYHPTLTKVSLDDKTDWQHIQDQKRSDQIYKKYQEAEDTQKAITNFTNFLDFSDKVGIATGLGAVLTKGFKMLGKKALSKGIHKVPTQEEFRNILQSDAFYGGTKQPKTTPKVNPNKLDSPEEEILEIPLNNTKAHLGRLNMSLEDLIAHTQLAPDYIKANIDKLNERLVSRGYKKMSEEELIKLFERPLFQEGTNTIIMPSYINMENDVWDRLLSHELDHYARFNNLIDKTPYKFTSPINLQAGVFVDPRNKYFLTEDFDEILARGSQLKDYFGITNKKGKLTPEHINYAKNHYVKDTGLDNDMETFFNSISDLNKFTDFINKYASMGIPGIFGVKAITNDDEID